MPTAIFCDFDGTITLRDVGYNLYHQFSNGRVEELIPEWQAGRLSTRDCLILEAEMVSGSADEIYQFVDQIKIDPTFPKFAAWLKAQDVPLVVASEGMEFYIKRMLARHKLDYLPVSSNIGHLENNSLRLEFPHTVRLCPGCGNCKAARISEYRASIDGKCRIIFIGDGYSDACGARAADHVFAKKDLVQYCQDERISYTGFDDFDDVQRELLRLGHLSGKT
jgi:2,3-diketo-5-methylthio-1-phosphopentane phosphatase